MVCHSRPVVTGLGLSLLVLLFGSAWLASALAGAQSAAPSSRSSPTVAPLQVPADWSRYKGHEEITELLQKLNAAFPDLVELWSIGKSVQGRDIWTVRLTNERLSWEKPRVLLVGYHHAREFISAEVPLYIAWYLVNNYQSNSTVAGLLDGREVYVVPALNPDGFDAAFRNGWHRKNLQPIDEDQDGAVDEDPPDDKNGNGLIEVLLRGDGSFVRYEGKDDDGDGQFNEDWAGGVDLNRNYAHEWGNTFVSSGSTNPIEEDFIGHSPFSEPESRALRDLVLSIRPTTAISYHSGTALILYPWGYTHRPAPAKPMLDWIAKRMRDVIMYRAQQASDLYTTSGDWDDWMYAQAGVFPFTIEVYGNSSALTTTPAGGDLEWLGGIREYFNPPESEIEQVAKRMMPSVFIIARYPFLTLDSVVLTEGFDVTPGQVSVLQVTVRNEWPFNATDVTVRLKLLGDAITADGLERAKLLVPGGGETTVTFELDAQTRGIFASELTLFGRNVTDVVRVAFTLTAGRNEAARFLEEASGAIEAARGQFRTIGLEEAEIALQSANQAFYSGDFENAVRLAAEAKATADRALAYWHFTIPILALALAYLLIPKRPRRTGIP